MESPAGLSVHEGDELACLPPSSPSSTDFILLYPFNPQAMITLALPLLVSAASLAIAAPA